MKRNDGFKRGANGERDPTRVTNFARELNGNLRALDAADGAEQNRFELSFSSEEPYRRYDWWNDKPYDEILDHADGAVDLSRLSEIGVLLFNHDRNQVIGRIESVGIEDRRGIATVVFDDDEESQKIAGKVRAGTLKGVSVCYSVDKTETVKEDGQTDIVYIRHWTPLEVSIVSIPADPTVGVGREFGGNDSMKFDKDGKPIGDEGEQRQEGTSAPANQQTAPAAPAAPADSQRSASPEEILRAERQRTGEITALCREFGISPDNYIAGGDSMDKVRAAVLDELRKNHAGIPNVRVTKDEGDKIREAMRDALLMRGNIAVEKPADGARDFRGMSLKDMYVECAEREGAHDLRRKSPSDLFNEAARAYYNPTAAFPSILDQTINKAYTNGYQLAPTTFELWTQRGTLSDFKQTQAQWRRGDAGELLYVPEGGELKNDVPSDEKMGGRSLKTYGRQFSMTREAFINDDIGFLTSLPARYAMSTKLTLNRQVYQVLAGNPTLEDGKTLFHSDHKNLAGSAGALNLANLVAAIEAMTTQTNSRNQIIQVRPQYLIVPTGLGAYARMLLGSPTIKTTALSSSATEMQAVNPVYNALAVVEDPELLAQLGSSGKNAWFLAANTATVDTIQVDYLNGVDTPTIRRMETPGVLGFVWDIYMDWGISVLDWRGMYKNGGAAPTAL